jgi:hypothetical protein
MRETCIISVVRRARLIRALDTLRFISGQSLRVWSPRYADTYGNDRMEMRFNVHCSTFYGEHMKYYLYISDTKVDMLLQQISHEEKKKIASEFKIDLKILGATWRKESEAQQSRISRLEAVCEFLNTFGNVGNADEPSHFIADTLPMKWNTYSHNREKLEIVYFGGITDKSIIGLAGSTHHLIGSTLQPEDVKINSRGMSIGPPIISWLEELGREVYTSQGNDSYLNPPPRDSWLRSTFFETRRMQGPEQNLEFLAKRLYEGDYFYSREQDRDPIGTPDDEKQWHIVIGTPLYVAMVD